MVGGGLREASGERPVRLRVQGEDATAEGPQQVRRHDATGPVARIQDDRGGSLPNRVPVDLRTNAFRVPMYRGFVGADRTDLGPRCHVESAFEEDGLDRLFVLAAHLHPAGIDRLEAVEFPRIVGGGHDDRSLNLARFRDEVLRARGGDEAEVDHVATGGHQPGSGRPSEHRSAEPRVAPQGDRASGEERADRAAHLDREVRIHLRADHAADAVRPEEARHAITRPASIFA